MKTHYRGTTRIEMERAGKALPKKTYQCHRCGSVSHDQAHQCAMGIHVAITPTRRG